MARTESREVAEVGRERRQHTAGSGSASDPYRWGRIVACRTVRKCAVPGQARNFDDEEEVCSLSALIVTRCLQYYDPAKAELSTYIARAVIRAVLRWVKYEYRYRTFTCPLDLTPGTRPAAHVDEEEPGGWESCLEASTSDEYDLGERAELARQVAEAMARLPEAERTAVRAYYWQGGGLRSIAPGLGVTFEGVRRRVRRGEEKLAVMLEGKLG